MSGKIKGKDLSYDTSLPPFLQRLHDQNAGRGDTDRHERQIARPTRPKEANEDDGPTVIDESGETVSKAEYEKLTDRAVEDAESAAKEVEGTNVRGKSIADGPASSGALPAHDEGKEKSKAQSSATEGAASRKRKVGKVIGDGDVEDEAGEEHKAETEDGGIKKMAKKAKKKVKPKLAFADDDEET
ncbi:hypothetical protein MBLNU230_g0098t1 [Neophaeotheca triangularis]